MFQRLIPRGQTLKDPLERGGGLPQIAADAWSWKDLLPERMAECCALQLRGFPLFWAAPQRADVDVSQPLPVPVLFQVCILCTCSIFEVSLETQVS